jgi:lactoylglutathione lyase
MNGGWRLAYAQPMISRALPVVYAANVERAAQFWELLGFRRHFQLPPEGDPGYVGLHSDVSPAEIAVTSVEWAMDRYGQSLGDGPRFEMYLYVPDLDAMIGQLAGVGVSVMREPEDMPWGERIATIADPDGNPVTLCQEK